MRSPISLGILFIALAALSIAGIGGMHLSPSAYPLVAVLGIAGGLVMTGHRAGYYAGLVAGGLTTITGVLAWVGVGGGHFGLPINPMIEVAVGLYLCLRLALASRAFFMKEKKRIRIYADADDEREAEGAAR